MSTDAMSFETQKMPWWLILMGGIANILLAVLLLSVPVKTVFALVLVLGMFWIIGGIFTLVGMFVDRTAWGWKLFSGLISIFAGGAILRYPLLSAVTIPAIIILMLGIQGVVVGIISLVMAFKGGGWGAGILGVLSILFGGVLIANYAAPGMIVTLVWVTAFMILFGGITQIFQAFQQRSE